MGDGAYTALMWTIFLLLAGGWVPVAAYIMWRRQKREELRLRVAEAMKPPQDKRPKRKRGPVFKDSDTYPNGQGSQDRLKSW